MSNPSSLTFRKGLRHGIPIALGYLSVSFAFGIQAAAGRLSPLQALLISMLNVTSAGQLAGLNLMLAGSSLTEMALTQFIINLRYALMSVSLTQRMGPEMNTPRRMIFSFCNTDEIFAVAVSQPEKLTPAYCYGLMLGPWLGWSLGTVLGAAAGQLLPMFVRTALGIAIYGMFLAIILPPARKEQAVREVVILSVAMSLMFRYVPGLNQVPGGFVIILCAVTAALYGALRYPVKEGNAS